MVEIVPLNEYGLQTAQYRIVIGAFDDGRVQGDKWSFRSERPQMNVMDVNHTRNRLRQVLPQEADVQASGCSFHQHVPGFLDESPSAAHDEEGDQDGQDRVDGGSAGQQDDDCCDDRSRGTEQVTEDM